MDGNDCIEYDFNIQFSQEINSFISDSRGGICEKPAKDIYEGKRVIKTLNSGIITVINHHTRTSALVTELTFAHEVGHSLGAEVFIQNLFGNLMKTEFFVCSMMMKYAEEMRHMVILSCIEGQQLVWKKIITNFPIVV
jgi:hypothetical protein